jgi:hypothetical protein
MVNGTLLNLGKSYNDNLRETFDQWLKPFSKLAAVFKNNLNWLKPFLKLAAVF